jgi:hypothetical protein
MPSHIGHVPFGRYSALLWIYRFYRLYCRGMSAISMRSTKTVIIAMCIYPDTIRSKLDTEVAGDISCPVKASRFAATLIHTNGRFAAGLRAGYFHKALALMP